MSPTTFSEAVQAALERHRSPEKAAPMARYMKNRFPFLGLKRPEFQPLVRPLLVAAKPVADEAWLAEATRLLWALPEREYQYTALDLLARYEKRLTTQSLPLLQELIVTHSWWDSVDGVVGAALSPLTLRLSELQVSMDAWSRDDNFWVRRAAILHQLKHHQATDSERLFAYCRDNAADPEFFVRKAIGWALRTYAYTDPLAVRAFVEANKAQLSRLSVREALKHL
ncbi:DNA alkylation repair protein [Armatimonas rosea]|uniref:3-methyladenine DNA glycosylase AlkD n=1 Tax=Armatimonas rosea TaxID=685828 RepID=A0A7W9SUN7_ARMRO|nr:DNA alkylation repair protein [Armatimonas rosea]MBB6053172.1 3-methyladenine DNA glycosylase AlkD [Armatimonas rosea]